MSWACENSALSIRGVRWLAIQRRHVSILISCILTPACIFLPSNSVNAETYYVWGDSGSDRNVGNSWNSAWKTLAYAGKSAIAGDVVIIRKSVNAYRYLRVEHSGKQDKPITFRGELEADPPVVVGARLIKNWTQAPGTRVWKTKAKRQAYLLIEDGKAVEIASSDKCIDGRWFWDEGFLYYRPIKKAPADHQVWRQSSGGSISLGNNSWINIENINCWISWGACVSINGGDHNTLRKIHAKWCWRGIDVTNKANYNLIEDVHVEENQEGIMVRMGSSFNTVRQCTVLRNGTYPLYKSRDRHAIGIGANGDSRGNIVENCEVAYNGGPPDNVAVIAFRAPDTIFRNNHVHDNYGSGIFVSLNSHGSSVSGNKVVNNGKPAVQAGIKGIVAVAIRNSKNVSVLDNRIQNNHVSANSIWPRQYKGVHGALDVDSTVQAWKRDMSGLHIGNNLVSGTIGGPNVHISKNPNLAKIKISPPLHVPSWLSDSISATDKN